MFRVLTAAASRSRVLCNRVLASLGLGDESFLLLLAVLVGMVTAGAAVLFHHLVNQLGELLYVGTGEELLYRRGLVLLIVIPAAGGLVVGVITRLLLRNGRALGVPDVIESVIRTRGFVRPSVAIEKIVTSGVTIGSGGSAGAEGPIVQIGAAISSGIGRLFGLAQHQMPLLIGCGAAAGISAIFNAPIGGVLFTLEVILLDFSIRTFTPVVVASVIANVSTRAAMSLTSPESSNYSAIFAKPGFIWPGQTVLDWGQIGNFVLLGVLAGIVGGAFVRLSHFTDRRFLRLSWLGIFRPAVGGALVGVLGVLYVIALGWMMLGKSKPIDFVTYPMPAFFGDGYAAINEMLKPEIYDRMRVTQGLLLLSFLLVAKMAATILTLGSGGSGGVIAPSLFMGATTGGIVGLALRAGGWFANVQPEVYAVAGMAAVLGAVVHAPMAAILIVFELTQDYKVMLAAMLATVVALAFSRLISRDSLYTRVLKERGINVGRSADVSVLRRLIVEQVALEPAASVHASDPLQRVLDLMEQTGNGQYIVLDQRGDYVGMVLPEDINLALLRRDAVPLMIVEEIARSNVPLIRSEDDLGTVLEIFNRHDVNHLPVHLSSAPGKVIGLISRTALLRRYAAGLTE